MAEINTTLQLLLDSLEKKKRLMLDVQKLTQEQADALAKDSFDLNTFNNSVSNKQVIIEVINELDEGFGPTFDRIKPVLTGHPELYAIKIKQLQDLIRQISDLAMEIQALEKKNHQQFRTKIKTMKAEVRGFRSGKKVADQYKSQATGQLSDTTQGFFDSKN